MPHHSIATATTSHSTTHSKEWVCVHHNSLPHGSLAGYGAACRFIVLLGGSAVSLSHVLRFFVFLWHSLSVTGKYFLTTASQGKMSILFSDGISFHLLNRKPFPPLGIHYSVVSDKTSSHLYGEIYNLKY